VNGSRSDSDQAAWGRELAEVASLAMPDEHVPDGAPLLISNIRAAVAAYAEAVSDDVADELCGRLFRVIWMQGRHVSRAYEVRRVVAGLMWPEEDITDRLASPDSPSLLDRYPDRAPVGGTIAPDGGPLTAAGWRRIRNWWTTGVSAAPPHQLQEQNRLMLDAGADMIGVMLSSPYTAERDVVGIASSLLAGT
jgi:hypothetical protein